MEKTPADAVVIVRNYYKSLPERMTAVRRRVGRPLTLAEKILFAHKADLAAALPERGQTTVGLHPDRVAMQDATAQMAILQFMTADKSETAVPTTIHCDHLIRAKVGAIKDLEVAENNNKEVYDFLASSSARYGMGFWMPGSGIIHQVILEHYAFPGGLIIGTDSHTPNAGGLGMLAIGVGGADAVDVMVGLPWELLWPKLIGVHLTGKLSGWTSGKDVILKLAGLLTVAGGTNKIIEYFGEGTESLSCTAKATVTNMGAELGATTSVFPFDKRMANYLRATGRAEIASLASGLVAELTADPEVLASPEKHYDEIVEIDLSKLEPHVVGPHTPDLARPVSQMAADVTSHDYPVALKATLIGSCTNSSYEDIGRAAHIARQARKAGLKARVPLMVTPGSEQVRATIERDGMLADLEAIGATVLANACGPCIGQWERTDIAKGEKNSILTSYNRNFPKRNDGNASTHAFIASPEVVVAYALSGRLDSDPIHDGVNHNGQLLKLEAPSAVELPTKGFDPGRAGYVAPVEQAASVSVAINPESERLALLEPFEPLDKISGYQDLPVLLKAHGKCTTDHISPAGPWLRFRGHLDRISDNMFSGANNAFSDKPGTGFNVLSGETGEELSKIARAYKAKGLGWLAVGDQNYGEGSSREHAAMCPRYLGCRAVLVRSFARIHETNLKKQGVLPLTFADPADYDRIRQDDRLSILGLDKLVAGRKVEVRIAHADGSQESLFALQSLTQDQIAWFMAGSALNLIRLQSQGGR
ncbi:MAG: aconitate hydratase [Gammaproteobacteria bacterium]|nr:aconitate hydratase [Gammaproteobacteria bacterium]MDH3370147.1 aconitate hydratase [Gammaproteobacteria bacterium]MDH3407063.1 aconitate hydratase [Gammaproteobacteria bacterium]MDH3562538.1 aconitate hydratase [Gammaproteobacteria bacterium]MDH5487348.1 aconitate hydratase [Gammaproteobacteria bacterium]